jgi:hypothetical protein
MGKGRQLQVGARRHRLAATGAVLPSVECDEELAHLRGNAAVRVLQVGKWRRGVALGPTPVSPAGLPADLATVPGANTPPVKMSGCSTGSSSAILPEHRNAAKRHDVCGVATSMVVQLEGINSSIGFDYSATA